MILATATLAGMASPSGIAAVDGGSRTARRGGWLLVAGGLLAVPLWLVFTWVHGPTSFNENRITLGRDMHFWGMLLGVIPNGLVAAGLWLSRPIIVQGEGRAVRVGYGLALVGLLVSAGLDLAVQALGPPMLLPFVGVGLLVLGLAMRGASRADRAVRAMVVALGTLFVIAFAWALVPLELSDRVGGYRIFGFMAHLVGGLGWALLGLLVVRRVGTAADAPPMR